MTIIRFTYVCLFLFYCLPALAQKQAETGVASYYGGKFQGRLMANGKKFDQNKLTAANNKLPLGTFVKVSNLRNRKSVIVEVTDRMHSKNKRLIDLSRAAAIKLNFVKQGLVRVKIEVVDKPGSNDE